jgi:hypothetical protein
VRGFESIEKFKKVCSVGKTFAIFAIIAFAKIAISH